MNPKKSIPYQEQERFKYFLYTFLLLETHTTIFPYVLLASEQLGARGLHSCRSARLPHREGHQSEPVQKRALVGAPASKQVGRAVLFHISSHECERSREDSLEESDPA